MNELCVIFVPLNTTVQAQVTKELGKWTLRYDVLKKQIVSSPDKLEAVSLINILCVQEPMTIMLLVYV